MLSREFKLAIGFLLGVGVVYYLVVITPILAKGF